MPRACAAASAGRGHPIYVQNVWGVGYCLLGD